MDFTMLTKAPGPSFPDFQDRDSYRGSGISVDRAHQALANLRLLCQKAHAFLIVTASISSRSAISPNPNA